MVESANPNTWTERPLRPLTGFQVTPPSRLSSAPLPRVPASARPPLNGLNTIVPTGAVPACAVIQLAPPFALRRIAPLELPAKTDWLFDGSTASAKIGDRAWSGSASRATHVESGSAFASTPAATSTMNQRTATVARRRLARSDTNPPIITQGRRAKAGPGRGAWQVAYNPEGAPRLR